MLFCCRQVRRQLRAFTSHLRRAALTDMASKPFDFSMLKDRAGALTGARGADGRSAAGGGSPTHSAAGNTKSQGKGSIADFSSRWSADDRCASRCTAAALHSHHACWAGWLLTSGCAATQWSHWEVPSPDPFYCDNDLVRCFSVWSLPR